MAIRANPIVVYDLKRELSRIRRQSLAASRAGDFMRLARLTDRAAQINRSLLEAEGHSYLLKL